jgi:hypothetical protein
MRRIMWFTAGAAAGVGGAAYAKRKARQAAERYKPVNMAKGAVDRFTDAVREGRAAMVEREAQLRARQEPPPAQPVPVYFVEVPAAEVVRDHRSGPRRRSRR